MNRRLLIAGLAAAALPFATGCELKVNPQTGSLAATAAAPTLGGPEITHAIAVLTPVGSPVADAVGAGTRGVLRFEQTAEGLKITGEVSGLTPGKHGFHVHEFGDVSDANKGESAGAHFNPGGHQHGDAASEERHAGDFGNIVADDSGKATVNIVDKVATLSGANSILGRAVVVHAKEDKFTQPSGDSGDRIAFGVVGVAKKP